MFSISCKFIEAKFQIIPTGKRRAITEWELRAGAEAIGHEGNGGDRPARHTGMGNIGFHRVHKSRTKTRRHVAGRP